MGRVRWCGVVLCAMLVGCSGNAAPQPDADADRVAIEQNLQQFSRDFNDRELDAVCGLFAPDVIVIYPESADRDHDAFCAGMQDVFADQDMTYHYAEPQIHDVVVDGDLASVRLTWTLTVTDSAGAVLETVTEDGVDVFRRQDDGSWKIYISHAFPV